MDDLNFFDLNADGLISPDEIAIAISIEDINEKNGNVYVSSGKDHTNISKIPNDRILLEREFPIMLDLYHRRQHGESISAESTAASINQSYWFGIFKELSL